jgi:branched-chain amino acid aminotransferase
MTIDYDMATLVAAVVETVRVNEVKAAYIRPLVYFALSPKTVNLAASLHNTKVHVCIMAWELSDFLSGTSEFRVTVSPFQKFSSKALPALAKTSGHYTNSVLAYTEAARRGFQEAILLNAKGDVAEATSENVFVVKNGRVVTNDASADILMGVTRDSVIALAGDLGVPVDIRPLSLADLHGADEVFLTGTAAEIKSVDALDDTRYGSHPITDDLKKAYQRAFLGEDDRHLDWLTFVH